MQNATRNLSLGSFRCRSCGHLEAIERPLRSAEYYAGLQRAAAERPDKLPSTRGTARAAGPSQGGGGESGGGGADRNY